MPHARTVTVNGRDYSWPESPTVVICCDGSEPAYMELAIAKGLMPNVKRIIAKGVDLRGQSVIPSFTNPNNLSIVTGQPPRVHGISGNYFFDRASKQEVMMNDAKYLRAPTIFEAFQPRTSCAHCLATASPMRAARRFASLPSAPISAPWTRMASTMSCRWLA
jgi:phosphonoacetate hydrolase